MNFAEQLERDLAIAEANSEFTEAVLRLKDGSRLYFCHRVDERWVKAQGADAASLNAGLAGELVEAIAAFRLNPKHLDMLFADGSRWESRLAASS